MSATSFARQDTLLGHGTDVFRLATQASATSAPGDAQAFTQATPGLLTAQNAIAVNR